MASPKFFTPYDEKLPRQDLVFPDDEPSLTQQQFAAECDINHIIKTFQTTGTVPGNALPAEYLDNTLATDYHDALNLIKTSEDLFTQLPSSVRARFENDPFELLTFVNNPDNRREAIALGLIAPPPGANSAQNANAAPGGALPVSPTQPTEPSVEALQAQIRALQGGSAAPAQLPT